MSHICSYLCSIYSYSYNCAYPSSQVATIDTNSSFLDIISLMYWSWLLSKLLYELSSYMPFGIGVAHCSHSIAYAVLRNIVILVTKVTLVVFLYFD